MEYVTAGYWQKEEHAGLFLSLQQRKYRKSGRNAVSACISDDGKIVRYLQDRIDDELSGKILWQGRASAGVFSAGVVSAWRRLQLCGNIMRGRTGTFVQPRKNAESCVFPEVRKSRMEDT